MASGREEVRKEIARLYLDTILEPDANGQKGNERGDYS